MKFKWEKIKYLKTIFKVLGKQDKLLTFKNLKMRNAT